MDNGNRKIGFGLLILGIFLMLITFYLAANTIFNPDFIKGFSELIPTTSDSGIGNIVHAIIYFVPAIILYVMGGIAGRILKHSIVLIRSPTRISTSKVSRTRQPPRKSKNEGGSDQEDQQEF